MSKYNTHFKVRITQTIVYERLIQAETMEEAQDRFQCNEDSHKPEYGETRQVIEPAKEEEIREHYNG